MSSGATWPRPRSNASTRAAWTRPIGPRGLAPNSIIACDFAEAVLGGMAGRVGERDRVADHLAVDEHVSRRRGVATEVLERQALPDRRPARPRLRPTTAASSPVLG